MGAGVIVEWRSHYACSTDFHELWDFDEEQLQQKTNVKYLKVMITYNQAGYTEMGHFAHAVNCIWVMQLYINPQKGIDYVTNIWKRELAFRPSVIEASKVKSFDALR